MKLLAIDIGNTTINSGLFENKKLKIKRKIATEKFKRIPFGDYNDVIIASVVPKATKKIIRLLKIKPIILDSKNIPIKIKVKSPQMVGSDRLVNAFAAKELYGVPAVVVDLGTATTFDVVSKNDEYIGGIIAPGIKISAESLYEKTAKLPNIKPEVPKNVIGKNTKEAILSGIFYGHLGLIKEVIEKVKSEKLKVKNLKVILTGGYATFFSKHFPDFIVDRDITLKGLEIIFSKIRRLV
ncbi:MAG: type III pantothenate kinase [Elusimicrobiota bacterium]|nr:type III pantothenate kinase [Elusimicrobiota bacterium]